MYLGSPGMTVAFRDSWTQKLNVVAFPLVLFFSTTSDEASLYEGDYDRQWS